MNLAYLTKQLGVVKGNGVAPKIVEEYYAKHRPLFSGYATSNFKVPRRYINWPMWYRAWHAMCTSAFIKKESEVCLAWRDSAVYKEWYDRKYREGLVICARFAFVGERLYGPYTTAFVTPALAKWMIPKPTDAVARGVTTRRLLNTKVIKAGISVDKERISLGRFNTVEEAHKAWILEKIKIGKLLLNENADNVIAVRGVTRVLEYLQDCYDNNKEVVGI